MRLELDQHQLKAMQEILPDPTPYFRATKKRRTNYRQRFTTTIEDNRNVASDIDKWKDQDQGSQNTELNNVIDPDTASRAPLMMEILQKRRKSRRTGGVEFKPEEQRPKIREDILVETEEESSEKIENINSKLRVFTRQTGSRGEVDRHMMAYVDSELAKLSSHRLQTLPPVQEPNQYLTPSTTCLPNLVTPAESKENEAPKIKGTIVPRQPATLGMLQEIDLGDEAREQNVKMTERATRRLDGEMTEDEKEAGTSRKKGRKKRPGKDGKNWWGRKGRRGDDIKRDQLVDQVLRENRLEIYKEPIMQPSLIQTDQAADDRIAEAFRREFMDNASARQRKKNSSNQAQARGQSGKKDDFLKGPKLGGSRSARAAVRETLLKSAKK
ncbi:putative mrna splicing factor rna helicase protein [Golovinomyces cichoracearum]|uniref:Putative mrna splicing factor rna helicase protein n=1 Tax=Golovinomyces cichoracearum TaxID=62708 RepID=A0A420J580_9PEZI|nr:putative mrna splicing factor rna helicase protein [Golovinomyces cichoracearum]